jgi:hypothetical protein
LRRILLEILLIYWVAFIGNTVAKLIEGGPNKAAAWYRNIGTWLVGVDGPPGTFVLHELTWRQFWSIQIFYLAFTLLFCVLELKPIRHDA